MNTEGARLDRRIEEGASYTRRRVRKDWRTRFTEKITKLYGLSSQRRGETAKPQPVRVIVHAEQTLERNKAKIWYEWWANRWVEGHRWGLC
jgi:hypothetical protein